MGSFANMTIADVERLNAKMRKESHIPTANPVPDGQEGSLHDAIVDECRRRSWIALHGSMARRTARTEGEWDFIILADGGRTFFVECKTANAVQSNVQLGLHHWAQRLGHDPRVVRSFAEFLALIDEPAAKERILAGISERLDCKIKS